MTLVLAAIWTALLLFAAGDSGRAFARRGETPPPWAWWLFITGWVVGIIHMLLAYHLIHGWSHADALHDTRRLTQQMFDVDFPQALYANFVFYAVWLGDAWWWKAAPAGYVRPMAATWILRGFYMLIIFNAAVVFAAGWRRILGLLLVSWLARAWSRGILPEDAR
jgi:hypothetical protein